MHDVLYLIDISTSLRSTLQHQDPVKNCHTVYSVPRIFSTSVYTCVPMGKFELYYFIKFLIRAVDQVLSHSSHL